MPHPRLDHMGESVLDKWFDREGWLNQLAARYGPELVSIASPILRGELSYARDNGGRMAVHTTAALGATIGVISDFYGPADGPLLTSIWTDARFGKVRVVVSRHFFVNGRYVDKVVYEGVTADERIHQLVADAVYYACTEVRDDGEDSDAGVDDDDGGASSPPFVPPPSPAPSTGSAPPPSHAPSSDSAPTAKQPTVPSTSCPVSPSTRSSVQQPPAAAADATESTVAPPTLNHAKAPPTEQDAMEEELEYARAGDAGTDAVGLFLLNDDDVILASPTRSGSADGIVREEKQERHVLKACRGPRNRSPPAVAVDGEEKEEEGRPSATPHASLRRRARSVDACDESPRSKHSRMIEELREAKEGRAIADELVWEHRNWCNQAEERADKAEAALQQSEAEREELRQQLGQTWRDQLDQGFRFGRADDMEDDFVFDDDEEVETLPPPSPAPSSGSSIASASSRDASHAPSNASAPSRDASPAPSTASSSAPSSAASSASAPAAPSASSRDASPAPSSSSASVAPPPALLPASLQIAIAEAIDSLEEFDGSGKKLARSVWARSCGDVELGKAWHRMKTLLGVRRRRIEKIAEVAYGRLSPSALAAAAGDRRHARLLKTFAKDTQRVVKLYDEMASAATSFARLVARDRAALPQPRGGARVSCTAVHRRAHADFNRIARRQELRIKAWESLAECLPVV